MIKSIFWRLCSGYILLVLISAIGVGFFSHFQLKKDLIQAHENLLRDNVYLLAPLGKQLFNKEIFNKIAESFKNLSSEQRLRITLVFADGTVYADSLKEAKKMENHLYRPEIQHSIINEYGLSKRVSSTVGYLSLYISKKIVYDSKLFGFLRLSVPLSSLDKKLFDLRIKILISAAISLLIALILGLIVTRKFTKPISSMIDVAKDLRSGNYKRRIYDLPNDEIGTLGNAINELSSDLHEKISSLSREESQLRAILSNMRDGVIAVSDEDDVLFCNPSSVQLLGLEGEKFTGEKFWKFTQLKILNDILEQSRAENESYDSETQFYLKGKIVYFNIKTIHFSSLESEGTIFVIQDLSKMKKLESIRKDFVANVSHELKTPLTSIKGYVETLIDGAYKEVETSSRFLGKIKNHVNQLTYLVEDLLDIARLDSETEKVSYVPVDLEPIIKKIIVGHEYTLGNKNIDCCIEGGIKASVSASSDDLFQIIDNLVSNAIKYTEENGKIEIRVNKQDKMVHLEIQDTGIGIPEKDLPRIFERFYRVDKARSRELGGTGLGLSIVKNLVVNLGGSVDVKSKLGKGSTFIVRLPS